MLTSGPKRKWKIIADFFKGDGDRWLDDFIDENEIVFEKVAKRSEKRDWHSGTSKITPGKVWVDHLRQSREAYRQRPEGVIACFPQLAMCAALWKKIGRSKPLIIAYNFNLGALRPGLRRQIARFVSSQIDCYVVHSPVEVGRYASYLGVPEDRFRFIPLQRGKISISRAENIEEPFILAMGSAHRDYPSLIRAVDRLGLKTTIITRASDVAALPKSQFVTFLSDMTEEECLQILARARICVTPIANMETASGQITFVNAMHLGVPVIATRCPGTEGYIEHGQNGLLVQPFDSDDLVAAIEQLWSNPDRRQSLGEFARITAQDRFSDPAAAKALLATVRSLSERSDKHTDRVA